MEASTQVQAGGGTTGQEMRDARRAVVAIAMAEAGQKAVAVITTTPQTHPHTRTHARASDPRTACVHACLVHPAADSAAAYRNDPKAAMNSTVHT